MFTHFRKFQTLTILVVMALSSIFNLNPVSGQTTLPVVLDIAWNPSGYMRATIDESGTLVVSLVDQPIPILEFTRQVTLVRAAASWSYQGDRLATGIGNRMYIWDTTSWQLLHEYEVGDSDGFFTFGPYDNIAEGVESITWSVDGRYVVTGTFSYETSVWDNQESQLIFRAGDLSGGGPGRVWLDDGWLGDGANKLNAFTGEWVLSSSEDNQRRFGGSAEGGTTEPRPDNAQIAWGTIYGDLLIIDLNTNWGVIGIEVTDNEPLTPASGIADISWDGTWNFIAVASRDGELYVVNLVTSEVTTVLNVDGRLNAVDWNPTSNQITYAGVTNLGEPILESVNVNGIGGVPAPTPTQTPTATPSPTATPTALPTATPPPFTVGTLRAIQNPGDARVYIERALSAGIDTFDSAPTDGWTLIGRTNGAGDNGTLRAFTVIDGVPYAAVQHYNKGCIVITPTSLAPRIQGQTRLVRIVTQNAAARCLGDWSGFVP